MDECKRAAEQPKSWVRQEQKLHCTSISACRLNESSGPLTVHRTPSTLWCIIHTDDKGTSRVWLEEYGASASGARLYAAMAGFELEEGETAQIFEIARTAARKIPNQMIGRVLEGAEFEHLMKVLAKTAKPDT